MAVATFIGLVLTGLGLLKVREESSKSTRLSESALRPNSFPFGVYSSENLEELSKELESRYFDLPRSARLPPAQQKELERCMEGRFLLLTGRRGLGKTRECVELFRRLAENKGEDVTILHPRGDFDRPDNATVPANFVPRTLILFIDEIETRCAMEDDGIAPHGQPVRTFHDRLAATMDWISARQGARDWKIVLTASDEAEDLRKINLGAGIFGKFTHIQLPAIDPRLRKSFIANVARHFSISIADDVLGYIAAISDGTPRGIVIPFAKRSAELDGKPGVMDLAYAKKFRFSYPSDWVSEVFAPLIQDHPERKAVFDALAILRHYNLRYDKKIVVSFSARLLKKYPLSYLNERIVSKTIKRDLRAWIFDTPGNNFLCPAAYIGHDVDVDQALPVFLDSIEAAAGSGLPFEAIQPALAKIERAAAKGKAAERRVIGFFRMLSRQYPNAPQIWNSLSKLCTLNGKTEEAYAAAKTAVAIDGGDVQSLFGLSIVEERRGHVRAAIDAARKATQLSSDNDFAWLNLGVLLSKRGHHLDAIKALQRACEINPEGARGWFSLGIAYERAGLMDEAIDACRRSTEMEPSNFAAWHTLGIAYDRTGEFGESIKALRQALKLNRSEPSIWLSLAWSLIRSGDKAAAIDILQQAQSLRDNDADLFAKLSVAFIKAGDVVRSDRAARIALEIDRDNEVAQRCLAYNLLHAIPTLDQGLEKLEELAASSSSASVYCALSSAYRRIGRIDEAIVAARRALAIAPENDRGKRSLAVNLGLKQPGSEEHVRLREELAHSSGAADDWVTLSVTYSKADRIEEAIEAARKALRIEPENAHAKRSLAVNLGSLDPGSEEIVRLREDLARAACTAVDWVTLSVVYGKAGRIEEAIEAARQALRIEPDHVPAKRSLAINLEFQRAGADKNGRLGEELNRIAGSAAAWGAESKDGTEPGIGDELAKEIGIVASGDLESLADEALRLREELADSSGTAFDWTALSIAYNKAGRPHDGVRAARRAIEIDPANKRARTSLAINLAITDPESAETRGLIEELDRVVTRPEELVAVSIAYSKAGMWEQAIGAAKRALQLDPSDYRAKRSIAINLANLTPGSRDAIELRQQVANASNLPEDWYGLGCLLGSARRFEESVVALQRALDISPDYEEAESALAQNLANLPDRVSEAIEIRERLSAVHGTAKDWTELSWAYGKGKRHDEAISAALKALALNPKQADAVQSLAINIPRAATLDDVVLSQIERALTNEGSADSWLQLARYYGLSRQHAKAVEWADKVVADEPTSSFAWHLKAMNLDALNRNDEADEAWEKYAKLSAGASDEPVSNIIEALRSNPHDKSTWGSLVVHYMANGDIDGAKGHIRNFVKSEGVVDSIVAALADVMPLDAGAVSSMLECVLELQDDHPHANHLAGTAKRKSGKPLDAIPLLEKACALAPQKPNYFYAVGRAFEDLGDPERAKDYFRQSLAIDPTYRKALNALRDLEPDDPPGPEQ